MKIKVYNSSSSESQEVSLDASIFDAPVKKNLLHDVVVSQLASKRQGTHKVKTRNEVSGGGAKPWRQKGTGRARAGSIRSPLFRGGGVIFGPSPRDYSYNVPKKVKRAALKSALTLKAQENAIKVVDSIPFDSPKTKDAVALLEKLDILNKKILLVLESNNENIEKSFRNIPRIKIMRAEGINVYDLLNANFLLLTEPALNAINKRFVK
ncbi:MAG: 50S ribosomal protein L4 [Nitrospinota bacterium]